MHESKMESDKDLAKENRPHRLERVEAQDRKNNAAAKKEKMASKISKLPKAWMKAVTQPKDFKGDWKKFVQTRTWNKEEYK